MVPTPRGIAADTVSAAFWPVDRRMSWSGAGGYVYETERAAPVCRLGGCGRTVRHGERYRSEPISSRRCADGSQPRATAEMNRLGIDPLDAYRERAAVEGRAARAEAARAELRAMPQRPAFNGDAYIVSLRYRAATATGRGPGAVGGPAPGRRTDDRTHGGVTFPSRDDARRCRSGHRSLDQGRVAT
ncbi:hypothetical protein [Protofrankia symbiont of Coriaria ruscifolia]|uniref:hypothetical protein n=1 Tax=Protofrankia symbiont of Coriaria ruscifolia TaxID=1306542 RepID=UPI001040F8E3|nr:hypothetical protein [Protofrankia symbiont of Coriaria ruscifolia]